LRRQPGPRRWALGAAALVSAATLTACAPAAEPTLTALDEPIPTPVVTTAEPTAAPATTTAGPPPCATGQFQLEVEQALAATGSYGHVTVDGLQSAEDCEVIIAFQKRMGIQPANGAPGPTTKDVAQRIAATDITQCAPSEKPSACVDLTHQTFFIQQNGQVLLGPTVTRTGMRGWATPAGTYTIGWRSLKAWSVPFSVWLPYWQNFVRGIGLHETTTYIHNAGIGSHGCVNLLHDDAKTAYELLTAGSTVQVYGRRPGT
jgi:lipoprotein-anchoring transpeptidase ErfK/SrfK